MTQASQAVQMDHSLSTPTKSRGRPFSSTRSGVWYDNDSQSGDDSEDDGDTDSLTSADSVDSAADTLTTPESSPPQHRHAVLHDAEPPKGPAVGGFDANGNWAWSTAWPSAGPCGAPRSEDQRHGQEKEAAAPMKTALNRHHRAQIAMSGGMDRLGPDQRGLTLDVSSRDCPEHGTEEGAEEDDDQYDVVGFTHYPPRSASSAGVVGEGHSIVLPVRIRLEDDSSSDESDGSVITTSSSGSDSEARRRASFNMLQRLGRNIKIPQRHTSALGSGAGPRRPPSLDEISHRVAGVGPGRRTPPPSGRSQNRAVSCPSPLLVQRAQFGEVEVMVTPPTPQMSTEKILGVVLKSPNMPCSVFSTDGHGNLIAPAFDVAPGRQIMLEDRQRQAKAWLESFKAQQQERQGLNLKLGTGAAAPPVANGEQAAATFTPSSPTRSKSPSYPGLSQAGSIEMSRQRSGVPPIPPRRRSFARKISDTTPPSHSQDRESRGSERPVQPTERAQMPSLETSLAPTTSSPATRQTQAAPRRSLVARLSLRKCSKEMQLPRKPVPAI